MKNPLASLRARFDHLYTWMEQNPFTVACVALALGAIATAGVFAVGLRGEDTRDKALTPCQIDASSAECQKTGRDAAKARSLDDSCIPFEKVLTPAAYRELTRCVAERIESSAGEGQADGQASGQEEVQNPGSVPEGNDADGTSGESPSETPTTPTPGPGPGASEEPGQGSIGQGVGDVIDGLLDGVCGTTSRPGQSGLCLNP